MSVNPDPDTAALSALGQIAQGLLSTQAGGDLSYGTLKRGFREVLRRDPLESIAAVVLGGSYLFYLAEKGRNPKIESFWDALTFITTCLLRRLPRTPAGPRPVGPKQWRKQEQELHRSVAR